MPVPIPVAFASEQPERAKAGVALAADDQVVMHDNAERFGEANDFTGHLDVGA